jgi:aldehyde:ferredoxin oxidoreductase
MIRDHFRVMVVNLTDGRGRLQTIDGRNQVAGGSGLGALLFEKYGLPDQPWDDSRQPLIFAIGPLTGYFPLMSKTVCAFKSPYHDQYTESHGGGRSALSLRFADLDALVITGRAKRPSALMVGSRQLAVRDVHYLWGLDVMATGKKLRRMVGGSGHRSVLRIGPAGEACSALAGINVDSYRHFGRLGAGAVMGAKNLKAVVIQGDGSFPLPSQKRYSDLFGRIHAQLTDTDMMDKYHNLGTAANVAGLNARQALPIRNLTATTDPALDGITGEIFADRTLLRNAACSGCPVGCIHIGYVREKFMEPNHYLYRKVAYDYEPIFSLGSMLGLTDPFQILALLDSVEKLGLDAMGAGVALAWATEALAENIITPRDTLVRLAFGNAEAYDLALDHLARGANGFYQTLAQGTAFAAEQYGGADFACVLGQEMAGYATGEVFFTAQALGFRHSHLDSGGYSYDQKHNSRDPAHAVDFLVADERARGFLTAMVACLFARKVYTPELLAEALDSVGYGDLAAGMEPIAGNIQRLRWRTRTTTGYDPAAVKIPKRFTQITTWKGGLDINYLEQLQKAYATAIQGLAAD